jgi:hypothetical protein
LAGNLIINGEVIPEKLHTEGAEQALSGKSCTRKKFIEN